jgi:hypothetical protein
MCDELEADEPVREQPVGETPDQIPFASTCCAITTEMHSIHCKDGRLSWIANRRELGAVYKKALDDCDGAIAAIEGFQRTKSSSRRFGNESTLLVFRQMLTTLKANQKEFKTGLAAVTTGPQTIKDARVQVRIDTKKIVQGLRGPSELAPRDRRSQGGVGAYGAMPQQRGAVSSDRGRHRNLNHPALWDAQDPDRNQ